MAVNINVDDPGVRRLLGEVRRDNVVGATPQKRELIQVAGDEDHGLSSVVHLTNGKHEVLVYATKGDIPLLTLDVYAVPGEPVIVNMICPRCKHHLRIPGDRKQIDWDPRAANPRRAEIVALGVGPQQLAQAAYGRLSIETFECTWELETEREVGAFGGVNLCRYRAAIDRNLLKPER